MPRYLSPKHPACLASSTEAFTSKPKIWRDLRAHFGGRATMLYRFAIILKRTDTTGDRFPTHRPQLAIILQRVGRNRDNFMIILAHLGSQLAINLQQTDIKGDHFPTQRPNRTNRKNQRHTHRHTLSLALAPWSEK